MIDVILNTLTAFGNAIVQAFNFVPGVFGNLSGAAIGEPAAQ